MGLKEKSEFSFVCRNHQKIKELENKSQTH